MILYPPRRQRRALPRLRIIETPQPILLESKEPCRGPQGARNWKQSTAAILWGCLFLISFLHSWMDLDIPLNPWKNHLKGNTKRLDRSDFQLMMNFIVEKVLEGGFTQFDSQQKKHATLAVNKGLSVGSWIATGIQPSQTHDFYGTSLIQHQCFFRPWTVVAPMDPF